MNLAMAGVGLCIFILLVTLSAAEDCVFDNRGKEALWEVQLIKDLSCSYNYKYPPNTNESFIEVKAKFILKYFNFDSTEELFIIYSWLTLAWQDDRLKWKAEDYGNLDEIVVDNYNIWYPSLRIMNGDAGLDYKDIYMVPCLIKNTGKVKCIQKVINSIVCSTKLWDWPYDSQKCKMEVGVWKYPTKKINLIYGGKAINMIVAGYGAQWDITGYEQEEDQNSDMQLRMIFTLERHGGTLGAMIIYPGIVLAVLTLTSFFLDARNNLRLCVVSFSLANQLQYLDVLEQLIPKHSAEHPSILLYYRGSIILTTLGVLLSVFLKTLCKKDAPPSALIERLSEYVVNSRWKYIIWRWDSQEEKCNIWLDYVSLVNSFILYVFTVTYICMYLVYVPQPIPFN